MSVLSNFDHVRISSIRDILSGELIDAGMQQTILTDVGGNIIAQFDCGDILYDASALAVLAASNIGSLNAMSRIIGEEEFPLFILKGQQDNIHFNKVSEDLFLITIFNQSLSIGYVRNKIDHAIRSLKDVIAHCEIA